MELNLDLSESGIDAALKKLLEYRDRVDKAEDELARRLTEGGTDQAKELAEYMNVYDTGELVRGIQGEVKGNVGYVRATAPHSAYCEFGTGVMGEGSPHPDPGIAGWRYDVNEHGDAGWWYKGDDGEWHWTKGMPSRPYMYETAQILKEAVPNVAKEVLEGD